MSMMRTVATSLVTAFLLAASSAHAEVTRVEIATRADVAGTGYEKIVGIVYFDVNPKDPHNRVIVDLDKATVNAAGHVEFSADLYILRPKDEARSNGVAIVDVLNRGRKIALNFNRASGPGAGDPKSEADLGDGFLMKQGYTIVWVGWEFDVRRQNGAMGIAAPIAKGVTGIVHGDFVPNNRNAEQNVGDLAGYAPAEPGGPDTSLTVRDGAFGRPETIAREKWEVRGNTVTMAAGFEPGRTYQLSYKVADPPVAGVGLLAYRDVATWVRHSPQAPATAKYTYAFGESQSGRFLREFLYEGCNTDEKGRQVFDAVWAHIAGAGKISLNERFAQPTSLTLYTSARFPFANASMRDPLSGQTEGLLDNPHAHGNTPKTIFTNTAVEYWGGGRSAALLHTTPDGVSDLTLPANERVYFLTGTQHSPAAFPPATTTGQEPVNPVNYWWPMRAIMVAMDQWVRKGVLPPASQVPRLADGTLVPIETVAFPSIPGVQSPKIIPHGRQNGTPIPLLVPQVGPDGNELAGIRLPDIVVPVATYTGWNFRNQSVGGTNELVSLMGSSIPLPKTAADRAASKDPRPSIGERYPSREAYITAVEAAADNLVKGGYVLAEDKPQLLKRAEDEWVQASKPQ
jgi:hypothetical protein